MFKSSPQKDGSACGLSAVLTALLMFSLSVRGSVIPGAVTYPDQLQRYAGVAAHSQQAQPATAGYLDVIEVDTPVKIPDTSCQVKLMEYSFANSYGRPFVGPYSPPDCDFNRVVLNFTSRSIGRQFDRLAVMYLNDTEVWRTSTAEPTPTGIFWNYKKDVSEYVSLWRQPQQIIFDLGMYKRCDAL